MLISKKYSNFAAAIKDITYLDVSKCRFYNPKSSYKSFCTSKIEMEYTPEKITKIENVVAHLYHRVSFGNIVKWLENFAEEDRDIALHLLGYMNLFTSDRIYLSLRNSLDKILRETKKGKIKIISVRKINKNSEGTAGGQSGDLIAYYARKVAESVCKQRIKVIREEDLKGLKQTKKYKIVLIDDIFGTGDTFINYYNHIKTLIAPNWEIAALAVAYMPQAEKKINRRRIKVYGEPIISIFQAIREAGMKDSTNESIYKKLSIKYGKKLYKAKDGNIKTLGYKNSQALIVFEYGVPNNTLPIIWSSKKENKKGIDWFPVFARNINDRLDKKRRYKNESKRWFFMAFKNGLHLTDVRNNPIGWGAALEIYLILSMLEKQKDEVLILNFLGISRGEYEEYLSIARENQLLDQTNGLTPRAHMALSEINAINGQQQDIDIVVLNQTMYLPDIQ